MPADPTRCTIDTMAAPPRRLLAPLFPDAVDIVGDVHGEVCHLNRLLEQLGYRDGSRHPDGRKLVFVAI